MTITHQELLDTSVAQLQTLASFLNDQLADRVYVAGVPEASACEAILRALCELIQAHRGGEERRA